MATKAKSLITLLEQVYVKQEKLNFAQNNYCEQLRKEGFDVELVDDGIRAKRVEDEEWKIVSVWSESTLEMQSTPAAAIFEDSLLTRLLASANGAGGRSSS